MSFILSPVVAPGTVIASSTWATRPLAASDGTIIRITDFGTGAGSYWIFDATAGFWRPFNGSILFGSKVAPDLLGAPIASLNGSAVAQIFALPTQLVIPAGMLQPDFIVCARAMLRRPGGGAAPVVSAWRFGTSNSVNDNIVGSLQLGTFAFSVNNIDSDGYVGNSLRFRSTAINGARNGTAIGVASYYDITTFFDTAQDMFVNFGIAINIPGDLFELWSYAVRIEG